MATKLGFTYTLSVDEKQSTTNLKQSIKNIQQKNSNLSVPVNLKLNTTIPREMITSANEALKKKNLSLSVGLKINAKSITNNTISEAQKILNEKNKQLAMTVGLKIDEKALTKVKEINNVFKETKSTLNDIVKDVSKLAGVKLRIFENVGGNKAKTTITNQSSQNNSTFDASYLEKEIELEQRRLQLEIDALKRKKEYQYISQSVISDLERQNAQLGVGVKSSRDLRENTKYLSLQIKEATSEGSKLIRIEEEQKNNEKEKLQILKEQNAQSELETKHAQQLKTITFSIKKLLEGQNGKFVTPEEVGRLKNLEASFRSLNGVSLKSLNNHLKEARQEINEISYDANIRRINETGTALQGLGRSLKNLGIYVSGAKIISDLWTGLKNGVQHIKDVDEAFTNMSMTMQSLTKTDFSNMLSQVNKLSKDMGAVSSEVLQIAQTFANDSTTLEEVMAKLTSSTALMNVSGMDATTVTKSIMSIANSYQLLEEGGANAAEVTEYLGDVLTKTSANMNYDFVEGMQGLIDGIGVAGSTMKAAGVDMEWYVGMLGNIMVATGQTADVLGRSMRTITARVMQQKQTLEELGESTEEVEVSMAKGEKALAELGVAIRDDLSGDLRSFSDIMDDLGAKWDNLTDTTKYFLAEQLAGKNQMDVFIGMMDSYEEGLKLVNSAYDAQGTLMDMNETYANSLQGKLNSLTSAQQELYQTIVDSDGFKLLIDGATSTIGAITSLIDTVGFLPTVFGTATMSFLNFSKAGRDFTNNLTLAIPPIGALNNKLLEKQKTLQNTIAVKQNTIGKTKELITSMQTAGMSTVGVTKNLARYQGGLIATQTQLALTTLKTIALQTAMSMGLSLAITAVATGLSKLIGWLNNYESAAEKAKKATESIRETSSELKDSLKDGTENLLVDLDYAIEKLNGATGSYENQGEIMSEINSLKSDLIGISDEYATILDNEELSLEEQVALVREMRKEKLLMKAEELNDKWSEKFEDTGGIETTVQLLEKTMSNIEKMKKSITDAKDGIGLYNGEQYSINQLQTMLSKQEELYKTHYKKIAEYNSDVKAMLEAGFETDFKTADLEKFREMFLVLTGDAEKLSESLGNIGFDDFTFSDDEIRKANEDFVALSANIQTTKDLLEDISKNGITIESAQKVLDTYKDFVGNINDATQVQEFLNNKIKEMSTSLDDAYRVMSASSSDFWQSQNAESEEYFSNNIKNTKEFEDLSIRVNNNLQAIHKQMIQALGDNWEGYYIDVNSSYNIDISNCKTAAEARLKIEQEAASRILELRRKIAQASLDYGSYTMGDGTVVNTGEYFYDDIKNNKEIQAIEQAIADVNAWKNGALGALGNIPTLQNPNFSNSKPLSSGSGSSSSSNKGNSTKDVEDLDLEIDRYYKINDALNDVNNALEKNRTLQDQTSDYNKRKKLMDEEIQLLNKQKSLLEDLRKEQEKELGEKRSFLSSYGFTFDGDGNITNYASKLKQLQDQANSLSGDAKKNAIENVKNIASVIEEYTKLSNETIPNTINQILGMTKTIEDTKKEHEKLLKMVERLGNRYFELEQSIRKVDNALSLNQAKQQNANATERVKLIEEEIKLLKDRQRLVAQQQKEVKNEADELKKKLSDKGVTFNSDGTVGNYTKLIEKLTKDANKLVGEARDKAVQDIEDLIALMEEYEDIVGSVLPSLEEEWEDYANSIYEAEKEKAQTIADVQKQVSSAIENEYNKRYEALKKSLQKEKDLYNAQYDQEDWDNNLSKEQRKLDEIQQQINNMSRDTSLAGQLKLQQLKEEYQAQMEVINQMIRDKEKENGNNRFDEEMDKLDQEKEEALSPENLADMVNKALADGFVTIGEEVIELNSLMTDWLNETGDGLTAVGGYLKNELIENLRVAQGLMENMGLIDVSRLTNLHNNPGLIGNVESIANMNSAISEAGKPRNGEVSQNVAIENLLTIHGNVTEDSIPKLEEMIDKARESLLDDIAKELGYR